MRRSKRQSADEEATALLSEAEEHHLATSTQEGDPVLRVLNGVLVEDWILFHGAIAGERSGCMGQRAVVSAYRVVADIPSYFVDVNKACPATTLYRSVQVKGRLCIVKDPRKKALMMEALMNKLQPEGGHVPLSAEEPLYDKDLRAVQVFGFQIEELRGKASLLQDRPQERVDRVVRGLWARGKMRDLLAIEEIYRARPESRLSAWTSAGGESYFVHPTLSQIRDHAHLLEGQYWREGSSLDQRERSIARSSAWVGAVSANGRLLGAARAVSDADWVARIVDVVVCPEQRGRGVGRKLMDILLDHPAVRHTPAQSLATRDAQEFYRQFGFAPVASGGVVAQSPEMKRGGVARREDLATLADHGLGCA